MDLSDVMISCVDRETFAVKWHGTTFYFNDCFNRIATEYATYPYTIRGVKSLPEIKIVTTNMCQLSCKYCYTYPDRICDSSMLDKDDEVLYRVIDYYARQYPEFAICFVGGGEPTLNQTLIETVLDYIQSLPNSVAVNVISNGLTSRALIDKLIGVKANIVFSLDGPYEIAANQQLQTYSQRTHSIVENNLKYIVRKKAPFSVNTVITADSLLKRDTILIEICCYFRKLGIQRLSLAVDNRLWGNPIGKSTWDALFANYINLIQWVPSNPEIKISSDLIKSRVNYLDTAKCQSVFGHQVSISILPNGMLSYCYNEQTAAFASSKDINKDFAFAFEQASGERKMFNAYRDTHCNSCIARQICFYTRCPSLLKNTPSISLACKNLQYFRTGILCYYFNQLLNT